MPGFSLWTHRESLFFENDNWLSIFVSRDNHFIQVSGIPFEYTPSYITRYFLIISSEMGFWDRNLKKYFSKWVIKILTKQQRMRFNYDNRLNNSDNIAEYSKYVIESILRFGSTYNKEHVKSSLFEPDVVQFLFTWERDVINLKGLFLLFGLGMFFSLFVFCI